MSIVIALFLIGLFLSAFFSGSETGFYRVTRVRLLLDGLDGDPVARGLLWLTNNPAFFVATTLVGNNLANYLTSLSIVLLTQNVFAGESLVAELVAPVFFAPVVFVYGELMPKNLFYYAPNLLLRRGGALFLLFAVVFAPVSGLLWLLGRVLQSLLGEAPLQVRLALARKELQQVLAEGQEAGLLQPAQRELANNLFSVASRPIEGICTPLGRMVSIRQGAKKADVLRIVKRHGSSVVPVVDSNGRDLIGYVRIVDLHLDLSATVETFRELPTLQANDAHIAALIQLQSTKAELARVVDTAGKTIGVLYASELTDPLFREAAI